MKRYLLSLILIFPALSSLTGQDMYKSELHSKVTISGYITDSKNGEHLAGVTVIDVKNKTGTSANAYGFYSITIPAGDYELHYSYIGYQTILKNGRTDNNLTLAIAMTAAEINLGEVVIKGRRTDENIRSNEMSVAKLDIKTIKMVPSLLGEVDLVKVLQLLPGVQTTSEGATGFSVRGGN